MIFEPLSDNDYYAIHDVIIDVFDIRLIRFDSDITEEIVQRFVEASPHKIKYLAAEWSWSDTEVRDQFHEWLSYLDINLIESIFKGPAIPVNPLQTDPKGPGSMHARFAWLRDQLDKRFPDSDPFSGEAPEDRYLAAIDKLLEPPKMSAQKTPVIAIVESPHEDWVEIKFNRSQIAKATYDAHGSDGMQLARDVATAIADKMKWPVVYR